MNLEIGNLEKALKFAQNLKEGYDKIALISHNDLDGIVAAKIMNKVVRANLIKFIDYKELNINLALELRNKKINKVIFTDLYIKNPEFVKELEKFSEILILDHHLSGDLNSKKTVFIKGEEGYSASYLCFFIFSKIKNLEKLDWLIACSCISDYCHIKPKRWLEDIFKKYGDMLEFEGLYVRKTGKFWDLQYDISLALIYFKNNLKKVYDSIGETFGELGNIRKFSTKIKKEIKDKIENFENKKEAFKEGYFYEFKSKFSITSIVINELSNKETNKVLIFISPDKEFYKVSIRRQDKQFDCNAFIQNLLKGLDKAEGGGHIPAAGGRFLKEDLPEFRKRLGL